MELKATSRRTYFFVYIALLALLASTIGAAYLPIGGWNNLVAVGIAAIKATLVILFFMNVRNSPNLTRIYVMVGFVWLSILIVLTLADYFTRVMGL